MVSKLAVFDESSITSCKDDSSISSCKDDSSISSCAVTLRTNYVLLSFVILCVSYIIRVSSYSGLVLVRVGDKCGRSSHLAPDAVVRHVTVETLVE